jgi:hypothetical protein
MDRMMTSIFLAENSAVFQKSKLRRKKKVCVGW